MKREPFPFKALPIQSSVVAANLEKLCRWLTYSSPVANLRITFTLQIAGSAKNYFRG